MLTKDEIQSIFVILDSMDENDIIFALDICQQHKDTLKVWEIIVIYLKTARNGFGRLFAQKIYKFNNNIDTNWAKLDNHPSYGILGRNWQHILNKSNNDYDKLEYEINTYYQYKIDEIYDYITKYKS